MAKKTSFGLGTVVAAAAGVVAGAVGMFLSDKDNRVKVAREVKHVEKIVEADLKKAKTSATRAVRKVSKVVPKAKKKVAKKTAKRK